MSSASSRLRVLARTADAVCAVDARLRIVLWNEAAEMLFGHAAREVVGRPCHEVFRGHDRHGCAVCGRECLASRMARACEVVPTREIVVETQASTKARTSATTIVFPADWHRTILLAHLFREIPDSRPGLSRPSGGDKPAAGARPSGAGFPSLRSPESQAGLTRREREVLRHLERGHGTASIAEELCVSPLTIRNHVRNILQKLGVHNRLQAVARSFSLRANAGGRREVPRSSG